MSVPYDVRVPQRLDPESPTAAASRAAGEYTDAEAEVRDRYDAARGRANAALWRLGALLDYARGRDGEIVGRPNADPAAMRQAERGLEDAEAAFAEAAGLNGAMEKARRERLVIGAYAADLAEQKRVKDAAVLAAEESHRKRGLLSRAAALLGRSE